MGMGRSRAALVLAGVGLGCVLASGTRGGDTTEKNDPAKQERSPLDWIPDAYPTLPRIIGYEYNQKNHHDAPSFEGPSAQPVEDSKSTRKKYRVLGVVARNSDATPLEAKIVVKGDARKVKIPPGGEVTAYFAVVDEPGVPLRAELRTLKEVPIAAIASTLAPAQRATVNRHDANFVAQELNNEERVREAYPSFPVSVRVLQGDDRPLSKARLTFLHDQLGLVFAGETDGDGRWSGRLVAGTWTALSFGVATEEHHEAETTVTKKAERTLYLAKSFDSGPQGATVELKADQTARVKVKDESGAPLELERITVAPHKVGEALRFADVSGRCSGSFILDLDPKRTTEGFELLTNKGSSYDLSVTAHVDSGVTALLTVAGTPGDGEVALTFAPQKMLRLILDPPTGAGGGRAMDAAITLLGAQRQSHFLRAQDLETVYVPAGGAVTGCRVEIAYTTRSGERIAFVPRRLEAKPGATIDLTPRDPFAMTVFTKDETAAKRGLQVWVALSDATGQIAESFRGEGTVTAWRGNEKLFDRELTAMSFAFPAGQNLANVELEARLRIGTETIRGRPACEAVRRFGLHGTWAVAPSVLQDHVDAFLGMVAKSCEAEKRFLGGPAAPVGMDFQVFLPPGVGGLGGGGQIALDLGELLRFTDETDPLPGAFCHELGHNVGFGHDPHMLMAPCGVEEGTYGVLGYRMMNGRELAALFQFLERRRCDDRGTWTLSPHVFAGLRQLYGPDVHKKMFESERMVDAGLAAAGLSSIERLATHYSLALQDNVAWLFRAYGWPVFDSRVNWGKSVALTGGRDIVRLNPDKIPVDAIRRWWIQGPLERDDEDPPWQANTWPSDFIAPDMTAPKNRTGRGTNRYRLFTRVTVPTWGVANLVAASDVALDVFVNGHAVAHLDASPQLSQPVHDELMLDHKKAFPVLLLQGENTIECDVSEPEGSRGFFLGLCGTDGRPIKVNLRPEGPDSDAAPNEVKLKPVDPVLNPGFEDVSSRGRILQWIPGPIEGGLTPALDEDKPASGKRSLKMSVASSCTGGFIQRVVVEPGAVYLLRAKIRAQDLDGEAYVTCFTGDMNNPITRTVPIKGGIPPRWTEITGQFVSQLRRCVYVSCYVKAKSGTAWFDDVELVREK
jgi:hypothetical protein